MSLRRAGIALLACSLIVVGGCSESDSSTKTTTPTASSIAASALEVRPIVSVLPPGANAKEYDVPAGVEVLPSPSATTEPAYAVGPVAINGSAVSSAKVAHSNVTGWSVELALTPQGIQQFKELAGRLSPKEPPGNSIALVVNGAVQSAPAFDSKTFDQATISITGDFSEAEAKALASSFTA